MRLLLYGLFGLVFLLAVYDATNLSQESFFFLAFGALACYTWDMVSKRWRRKRLERKNKKLESQGISVK